MNNETCLLGLGLAFLLKTQQEHREIEMNRQISSFYHFRVCRTYVTLIRVTRLVCISESQTKTEALGW